jgi:cytochrome P450
MQAYTVHHNERVFPEPDAFKPERWASGGTQEMRDASLQWSKGTRMCPGLHLATMELKMVLVSLVLGWEIGLGERMQEDTMDMMDHLVLMPKGNFCDLVFTPLKS